MFSINYTHKFGPRISVIEIEGENFRELILFYNTYWKLNNACHLALAKYMILNSNHTKVERRPKLYNPTKLSGQIKKATNNVKKKKKDP